LNNQGVNQIARRIHDGIAQDLVALGYSLDQALGAPELPISTRAELRSLRFGVTDLIEKVRREILSLRTSPPDLSELAKQICGSSLGDLDLQIEVVESALPIVVELLRNASIHSGASLINLRTFKRDALTVIEISDNGTRGIELKNDRFGLVGVRELVSELSGQIEFINLAPGLLIRVSIPS
jgi:signal transduction histidine kinase